MRGLLNRYEVWIFLTLIVVVQALFITAIDLGLVPSSVYNYGRFALLGGVLVGVAFLSRGWPALVELVKPMTKWRINPMWYLLAICWGSLVGFFVLLGHALVDGDFSRLAPDFTMVSNPGVAKTIIIGSFIGEIVWVSYSLSRLSRSMDPLAAAFIVGIVWTLWWLPMVVLDTGGVIPNLPVIPLFFNQIGIAIMCCFVYLHTRSGLCVLLLQICVNSSVIVWGVAPRPEDTSVYTIFAFVYFFACLALYLAWRPGRSDRDGEPGMRGAAYA